MKLISDRKITTLFKGFNLALILSLLVHVIVLIIKFEQTRIDELAKEKAKEERIKIVLREKPKKELKKDQMQVVENEDRGRKEKPLETRFLGKEHKKYDRQTVAKNIGSFKKAGKGIKTGVMKKTTKQANAKPKKKALKKAKKGKVSLADLSVSKRESKVIEKVADKVAARGLRTGSLESLGLSQTSDYVDDVPLGDMTQLNTIEYKYYGFYHRIKQKLEQYWGNSLREKARALAKTGRRIPSSAEKITSLSITIDDKGNIIDVYVKSTSGVKELDDAAVESFNRAGPFPNPPKGMMKNGQAQIEWGFVVKG